MGEKSSKLETKLDHLPIKSATPTVLNPKCLEHRLIQNVLLLWIDRGIHLEDPNCQQNMNHLRERVNDVVLFTDVDACIEFLDTIHEEKVIIVTSGSLGQDLIPKIHDMDIIERVYIFCQKPQLHKKWIKSWTKIKDAYTMLEPILQDLDTTVNRCNDDLISLSFINTNQARPCDAIFTYTQAFKRVLLSMTYDDESRGTLSKTYLQVCANNSRETPLATEFSAHYHPTRVIWWYTRLSFINQMFNRSVRLLEADLLIDMGFLISDLHRQLEELHEKQFGNKPVKPFTIYRGQGISEENAAKLQHIDGGLISCNSFLSASKKRSYALQQAKDASNRNKSIGILFTITVDPNVQAVPFANISEHSYEGIEGDFLFSMHTLFRIGHMKALDKSQRLFEVPLVVIESHDAELHHPISILERGITARPPLAQLAYLLIKIGEVTKAEQFYSKLLHGGEQEQPDRDRVFYLHELGRIKELRDHSGEAIRCYEEALPIEIQIYSTKYSYMAHAYSRIGQLYLNMGDLTRAVIYFEDALRNQQRTYSANDLSLAPLHKKLGSMYHELQQYERALPHFEKVLAIQEKNMSNSHFDPIICKSLATIHVKMGSFDKALPYFEKELQWKLQKLPPNDPSLGQCYSDIGTTYAEMNDYDKAIACLNQALEIKKNIVPCNDQELSVLYNNLGSLHNKIGKHKEALRYYEKDLAVCLKILPKNDPDLMTSYNNLGGTYYRLQDYRKALTCFEQALRVGRKSSSSHAEVESVLRSIELVKKKLEQSTEMGSNNHFET